MRVFLAIDLPQTVKKKIFQRIEIIRNYYSHYNWVNQENYHITLFFFGEIDESEIEKIKRKISNGIWDIKPFYLYTRSISVFSKQKHVLYINFYREKEIELLATKIRNLFDNKYKTNKQKYIPHLTLARGKRSSKQQYFALLKKLKKINIKIGFSVNKIKLYQSILTPERPVYKQLWEFNLNKS